MSDNDLSTIEVLWTAVKGFATLLVTAIAWQIIRIVRMVERHDRDLEHVVRKEDLDEVLKNLSKERQEQNRIIIERMERLTTGVHQRLDMLLAGEDRLLLRRKFKDMKQGFVGDITEDDEG